MKIAVCGSAPSSAHLAPVKDASFVQFSEGRTHTYPPLPEGDQHWEIWGCSPGLFGAVPRATRWFELHRWEPGAPWFSPEYCQFLREFKGPVYTGGPIPEIPNHVVYPLKEVEEQFSPFFLTSSLSLMAAEAIRVIEQIRKARSTANPEDLPKGIDVSELQKDDSDDVIGFWGVDMSANEEYSRQKPGCWFFGIQIIERGIGLYYPPESDLFCPEPVYGISEWDHSYIKATARMRELTQRFNQAQAQAAAAQAEMHMLGGAKDDLNYQIKTWLAHHYALPAGKVLRKT